MHQRKDERMSNVTPGFLLTDSEKKFCAYYKEMIGENPDPKHEAETLRRAYNHAYPDVTTVGKQLTAMARKLYHDPRIQNYFPYLNTEAKEMANQILSEQAATGDAKTAFKAAETILKQGEAKAFDTAVQRWASIMCQIGAEVVYPIGPGKEIVVPFSDLVNHKELYKLGQ